MKSKGVGHYKVTMELDKETVIMWKRSTKNLVSEALSSDYPEVKDRWNRQTKKS